MTLATSSTTSTTSTLATSREAPTLASATPRSRCDVFGRIALLVACIFISLAKLWLIRGNEIIARQQSYDDLWYLNAARQWYWSNAYYEPFLRGCAYPLWIAIVRVTGMPLLIATEMLSMICAYALCAALATARIPRWVCAIAFAAMVLHPLTIVVGQFASVDTLYAPLLWLAVACWIRMWTADTRRGRVWLAIASGFVLAALWHTREERLLIPIYLAAYAILTAALARSRDVSWRWIARRVLLTAIVPIIIVVAIDLGVRVANYVTFGLFSTTDLTSPGYQSACRALLGVKPAHPETMIPVPAEVRRRIYEISPAFAELRPFIEGEAGQLWAVDARRWTGIDHDIPGVWFYWAMRHAVDRAGYHTPRQTDEYFRGVADEINRAIDDGRLASRRVYSDFVDPEFSNFVPELGSSLERFIDRFTTIDWAPGGGGERAASKAITATFDTMANRREVLVHPTFFELTGWAVNLHDPIREIELRDRYGQTAAQTDQFTARPDIATWLATLPGGAEAGESCGYHLSATLADAAKQFDGDLVFHTRSGAEFVVPLERLRVGAAAEIGTGPSVVKYGVDSFSLSQDPYARERRIVHRLWRYNAIAVEVLTAIALSIAFACLAAPFPRGLRAMLLNPVVLLIAFVIALRLALLTLIDASSWPAADDLRYLLPIMPLYTVLLLVAITSAIGNARHSLE